jgi:hydroxyacylglutathione hydrolase
MDNYIYVYAYEQDKALVVDPCDSRVVLQTLAQYGLHLTTILVTHHHGDHTAGIRDLKKKTSCQVIGADKQRISGLDKVVTDGGRLSLGPCNVEVLSTPGHTRTGVCYYLTYQDEAILWTGDTLFVGGCGRLFECDARTMWSSLQKLVALPGQTQVYCGHEYTLENCAFALSLLSEDFYFQGFQQRAQANLALHQHTMPSTLLAETQGNIFLRAHDPKVASVLGMPHADPVDVFAELRRRKNRF